MTNIVRSIVGDVVDSPVKNVIQCPGGYSTTATDWDGSSNFGQSTPANLGIPGDSPRATFCFAFKPDALSFARIIHVNNARFLIRLDNTGKLAIQIRTSSDVNIVQQATTDNYTAGAWNTFLFSFDMTQSACHAFLNDVDQSFGLIIEVGSADFDAGLWTACRQDTGSEPYQGCLAHVGFHGNYIDLTVEANRRTFFDADGVPVDGGADGSDAFGVTPIMWFPDGDLEDNRGSGGGFLITGTPGVCSDSPTD
jgi:hypothetical protein